MAEVLQNDTNNCEVDILKSLQSKTSNISATNLDDNLKLNDHQNSEKVALNHPNSRLKKRIRQLSDSDSDREVMQDGNVKLCCEKESITPQDSDNDSDAVIFKSINRKSRIRKVCRGSSLDSDSSNSNQAVHNSEAKEKPKLPENESDSDTTIFKSVQPKSSKKIVTNGSSSDSNQAVKYEQQQMRMKNKRNNMKDKFKNLINSRGKELSSIGAEMESIKSRNSSEDSDNNVEDNYSIENIKQKIKQKMSYKPSICDPDTSDEESIQQKSMPKQKKVKRIKLTSPKPQRMSAKQAMENMQKIKSESNRMLREKEVSLPYHRPKALSLKDIMSRRKPAMSSDGKCLPIKMNGEQLKQYAQILEDRQKQMMELWQSDTDEENYGNKSGDEKSAAKASEEAEHAICDLKKIESTVIENAEDVNTDISVENDKLFDVLSQSIIEQKNTNNSKVNESNLELESINEDKVPEEQDSETNIKLVFNDSETSITEVKQAEVDCIVHEVTVIEDIEANNVNETNKTEHQVESAKTNTESDSQLVSLHYDTETLQTEKTDREITEKTGDEIDNIDREIEAMDVDNGFSDDDMYIEDIDNIIADAEIIRDIEDKVNSQVLIRDRPLNLNPKLTGAPGMVIDLENSNTIPKKSGVELLKERFTFFAKLKTPEELERDKDRKTKPGNLHVRLKQELEEQMAEQRSLEWAKRLEDEKQHQKEMKELRGEESDDENDIDKIEAKLEEGNEENDANDSESEDEELLENDIELKDKPIAKNPMLENEAEESDCDEKGHEDDEIDQENAESNHGDDENEVDAESSDESEYSESEEEQPTMKKGRILKAFEDSDDEDKGEETKGEAESVGSVDLLGSQVISQDEVLTLAQRQKSVSEDLFTSQGSTLFASQKAKSEAATGNFENDTDLGTQTFSILDSTNNATDLLNSSDKLSGICETQPYDDNLNAVAAMCSGSFSQSLPPLPITQFSQSQPIGEEILALCTGKFYENEFVSQVIDNQTPLGASQDYNSMDCDTQTVDKGDETKENTKIVETEINREVNDHVIDTINEANVNTTVIDIELTTDNTKVDQNKKEVDDNLKSILEELDDPEFDLPKPNRFFFGATQRQEETQKGQEVVKKKFIIDSDDDTNDANASETKKRKLKKKKPEKRALQISDDEEEEEISEQEEYESDIEEENVERLVEYDSEENEIEVIPQNQKPSKKKRKGTEFFEQEAELTSEDEWVGSGDEDEAGLDRMEREAGDDESFHQGRLQRELGQIHMRDVLDQDKREVRIIQELLFEDGDLGAGGRQRKFKWKNLDGNEETGTGDDEFRDTPEEEFESEEQWRKQRHERETFLRQMQNNGELDDSLNVSINRTSIIKANLMSRSMSTLLAENQPVTKNPGSPLEENKTAKDIPSPKKSFSLLQQSYQGSILNRGRGALARLAALATPLAVDDDAPKGKSAASGSRRNFVFATLTPEAPKVTKRKAMANPSTPALVKKMKTEEQNMSKNSLLDHMKV